MSWKQSIRKSIRMRLRWIRIKRGIAIIEKPWEAHEKTWEFSSWNQRSYFPFFENWMNKKTKCRDKKGILKKTRRMESMKRLIEDTDGEQVEGEQVNKRRTEKREMKDTRMFAFDWTQSKCRERSLIQFSLHNSHMTLTFGHTSLDLSLKNWLSKNRVIATITAKEHNAGQRVVKNYKTVLSNCCRSTRPYHLETSVSSVNNRGNFCRRRQPYCQQIWTACWHRSFFIFAFISLTLVNIYLCKQVIENFGLLGKGLSSVSLSWFSLIQLACSDSCFATPDFFIHTLLIILQSQSSRRSLTLFEECLPSIGSE